MAPLDLSNPLGTSLLGSLDPAGRTQRTSFERLSSGLRINDAVDDAAGLAIASQLERDTRAAAQALRNANDGLSALGIATHALGQVGDTLGRLAELAAQAASGTLTDRQRNAIQGEFGSLVSQLDQVAATTSFNGVQLLSGGGSVTVEVGIGGGSSGQLSFGTVDATATGLGLGNVAVSDQASAQAALGTIDAAINALGQSEGKLGAAQSQLLTAVANVRVSQEQFAAAQSRIQDADVADASAALVSATIRDHAAVALLAQANQQSGVVLKLLR